MGAGLVSDWPMQAGGLEPTGLASGVCHRWLLDAGGDMFIRSLQLHGCAAGIRVAGLRCGKSGWAGQHGAGWREDRRSVPADHGPGDHHCAAAGARLLRRREASGEDAALATDFRPKQPSRIKDTLVNIFPTNPVAAMAKGNMLQVIVFALLLGCAEPAGEPGSGLRRSSTTSTRS